MANELSILIRATALKGNFRLDVNPGVVQYDMASGTGGTPGVVSLTTSASSINFGSVTPGYVYLRNLSTGEKVKVSTTSGLEFCELTAGKIALIPKGATAWQAAASTAGGTPDLDIRSFST